MEISLDQHTIEGRILRTHNSTVTIKKLEICAAIASDIECDVNYQASLNEILTIYSEKSMGVSILLKKALDTFEVTFQLLDASVYIPETSLRRMPCLKNTLIKIGMLKDTSNLFREVKRPSLNKTLIITGGIGYSFGSYSHLASYIQARILGYLEEDLLVYAMPREFQVIPALLDFYAEKYEWVTVRDIGNYLFKKEDLQEIYCHKYSSELNNIHKALIRVSGCNSNYCLNKKEAEDYPRSHNRDLVRLASKVALKSLGEEIIHEPWIKFNGNSKADLKTALIINRDSKYVGDGQPHRDVDISMFYRTIEMLLNNKWKVCRFNGLAKPTVGIDNESFMDITKTKHTHKEQLSILKNVGLIIGVDTGALLLAHCFSNAPTLLIDNADLVPPSPWGLLLMQPKSLKVYDSSKLRAYEYSYLVHKLFLSGQIWSNDICSKYGLFLESNTESEIELASLELIECSQHLLWNRKPTLHDLGKEFKPLSNVILTEKAYQRLDELLLLIKQICLKQ